MMTAAPAPVLAPFLRVPPFPGARPISMVVEGAALAPLDDAALDRAIAAIAAARVGGDYWGVQPALPAAPYTLVRVRDAETRAQLLGSAGEGRRLLCWVDAIADMHPAPGSSVTWIAGRCDPWHVVRGAAAVVCDRDDDLVPVAALAGLPIDDPDRQPLIGAKASRAALRKLVSDRLGARGFANPFGGEAMSLTETIDLSAFWRRLIDSNRDISAAIGFASWKRPTAAPLLWGGSGEVPFTVRPRGVASGDRIASWKARVAPALLAELECHGAHLIEVEDGFIRSVGLGADCVPPLSLVVDRLGAYFDPQRPSELEQLLEYGTFPADLVDRARRLRTLIVDGGISKYGAGAQRLERRADGHHLLVPGQVEDDRSVLCGGGTIRTNLDLLRAARREAPEAYIIYKPHPDVEAGHRIGAICAPAAAEFADEVIADQPISSLIEMVDEIHVNTSLAGFEALLRGKPVTTHGAPFYAGWGLTRDLGVVPARRTATRTLDELVAAVLLLYPRYLDPVTGLPCTPEILVRRLAEGAGSGRDGPLVPLRRVQGYLKRRLSSLRDR